MASRRQIVIAMAAGLASGLVASAAARMALADTTSILQQRPLPALDDPEHPSFEVFHRLSEWVTARDRLDVGASRLLYPVFMAEPWGPKHIAGAFSGIAPALERAGAPVSVPELVDAGLLPEGETWFVSHLLTTWYLGVYYHETGTKRVLNHQALMWSRVGRWAQVRGVPSGAYGDWVEPPEVVP